MTLGDVTSTLVVFVPQPEETAMMTSTEVITDTESLTDTEEITGTPGITGTAPITPEIEAPPTVTATVTVTPTIAPTLTAVPAPSETPAVTATATVTIEATPEAPDIVPTSNVTANLRSGPATTFDLVGTASPGEELDIVAISEDAQWYLLSSGEWIFADLVSDVGHRTGRTGGTSDPAESTGRRAQLQRSPSMQTTPT